MSEATEILGQIEVDAKHLRRQLMYADECGAMLRKVLLNKIDELREIRRAADCLIAEAEAELVS